MTDGQTEAARDQISTSPRRYGVRYETESGTCREGWYVVNAQLLLLVSGPHRSEEDARELAGRMNKEDCHDARRIH